MSVLKAENLTKKVTSPEGMLTIVNDVCLDIAAGESVAIVGASGAGKSTLLALLAMGMTGLSYWMSREYPMALLFVNGVMNVAWMGALTAFVLVEKLAPAHAWTRRFAGVELCAWGVAVAVSR